MADIAKPWPLKFELESDYSNFKYWKSCVESYLEGEGLVEITCGSGSEVDDDTVREDKAKKWRAKRGKALYILKTTINKDLHRYIEHAKTPRDAWCILNSLKLYKFQLHKFPIGGDRKYREHGLIAERAKEVYEAAEQGKFETLEDIVMDYPITASGKNGLHVVAEFGHIDAMHKLLDRASAESLSSIDNQGNTILHKAAIAGKRAMVHAILSKNSSLVTARNHMGETPLFLAALHGHEDVFACLATQVDQQSERGECCLRRNDGATILHVAVNGEFYDLALEIIEVYPTLGFARDEKGVWPLHILAMSPKSFKSGTIYYPTNVGVSPSVLMETIGKVIYSRCPWIGRVYRTKQKHEWTKELVRVMVERDSKYSYEHDGKNPQKKHKSSYVHLGVESTENGIESPLILAVKQDIVEAVKEILKVFPEAVGFLDKDGKNILLLAAEYRAEKVFKILRSMGRVTTNMVLGIDKEGNSVLHLAAKLQSYRPPHIRGSSQHMQWEILWYKIVKHVCPPCIIPHKNLEGQTARELFTVTHNGLLKEGEQWLKEGAKSCMIVSTLIATILYATCFAVPGGNQPNGLPNFLHNSSFRIYMDYLEWSLFASSLSLAFFTSILTTRYEEEDFYFMLPMKYIVAATCLFLSTIGGVAIFSYAYILQTDGIFTSSHVVGKISFFISMTSQIFVYIDSLISTIMYCVLILFEELGKRIRF
ncbi:hypothetical protein AMTR_s00149p00087520 [Amborella trichopoda]|uniref:PGG domain-containing protein n=1 Tax=Amborella trichopoda TaxID=13333 RepID=W1PND2_AMBTC|nr:hypothetical protein AMTR_s00149p00087520 [Amborella trichopoda]